MENINITDVVEIIKNLKFDKTERNGFIFLPSINGFDVFTISEDRLKLYLQAEGLYNKTKILCKECEKNHVEKLGMICNKCESYREQ